MSGQITAIVDPDDVEHFRVMIDARTRHPDLWPLVRRFGSVKGLAQELGANVAMIYQWVNLHSIPNPAGTRTSAVLESLSLLTNKSFEEMWPSGLRQAIGRGTAAIQRDFELNTSMLSIARRSTERLMLPDPCEQAIEKEMTDLRSHVTSEFLKCLTERQQQVLKLRYGIDSFRDGLTLVEAAKQIGISVSRVRQIEMTALGRLRKMMGWRHQYPEVAKPLVELDEVDPR